MKNAIFKNKTLLHNFASLSVLQFANYLFPLITFPYLVRVLGPEKFGLVSFATAFTGYFGVLIDYGFNLSAPREVSINRDNRARLSEIFSSILVIKAILLIVSFLVLVTLLTVIPKFREDSLLYLICFGTIAGSTFFPVWVFQGLEKMKYITVINLIPKFIVTILIFFLIKNPSDYLLYASLISVSFLFSSAAGIILVTKLFKIRFMLPDLDVIKYHFIEGWYLFVSSVSISLYTISNVFILGLFTNNTIVGYFSAADKIRSAVQNIFSTISQTVYPHISYLFKKSKRDGLQFAKKLLYFSGSLSLIVSLTLFIFARQIVMLILGDGYENSILVLRIIAFLPFIITLSNIVGIQTMLNLHMKKAFTQIIGFASIVNIVLAVILVPLFYEVGTSISVVVTEIIVTAGMIGYLVKKKVNILKAAYV